MKTAIDIIEQELRDHIENKGTSGNSVIWENGFIDGLLHIHNVLLKANSQIFTIEKEIE